jgi:uncharacterized protein (TIGR03437 family)
VWIITLAAAGASIAFAQTQDWRHVGGSAVEMGLAGPATGPLEDAWFSDSGSTLYVRTRAGRVFQTSDFESWVVAENPPAHTPLESALPRRKPDPGGRVVTAAWNRSRMYELGSQLLRSDDGGDSWDNLTAYRSSSVIGSPQRALAITPNSPDQLVVANDDGVWRSMDGGLSWTGLNQSLPNLPIRRIMTPPVGGLPALVEADGLGILALPPGGTVWMRVSGTLLDAETALKRRYSAMLGEEISAVGSVRDTVYAGSANGHIWYSLDGGKTFRQSATPASGRVERIFVDSLRPNIAVAALSGKGPHVLRTMNQTFWDAIDGNLPDASVHGVTADRASGAIYAATDKGVFWTTTDLETASGTPPVWTSLSENLPQFPARDVVLDPSGLQLYAALDGYGLYAIAAPHHQRNIQVVNAADFSSRPAAPGSLLSVIGGRVESARGGNLNYPVLAVLGNESQIQVPFEAQGPNVNLALQIAGGGTVRRDIPVQPVSPAILVSRDGAPMLWDGESGLPVDARNLAHPNSRLQIWATGLGKVKPDWPTGMQANLEEPPAVIANIKAYLDGVPVPVTRSTLLPGYVGFYLVEVQLPPITNAGASQLYITADGQESNRVIVLIAQ